MSFVVFVAFEAGLCGVPSLVLIILYDIPRGTPRSRKSVLRNCNARRHFARIECLDGSEFRINASVAEYLGGLCQVDDQRWLQQRSRNA